MTSGQEVHTAVGARLRQVEQRYTASRRRLVDVLAGAGRPLTIPEILSDDARLPQSSAYRNLAVLEQAGVVRRVQVHDEFARYELDEDLTEHHHHLVCVGCGRIADYTVPRPLERALEKAIARVTAATGFDAHSHRLDLVGLCASCR
jgi:Fe2+ or Zn2+ uptake regulation protein